jgi:hypothetical protein
MSRMGERTNVTNLLRNRQSGRYYARVKVHGKQKWRTLGLSRPIGRNEAETEIGRSMHRPARRQLERECRP